MKKILLFATLLLITGTGLRAQITLKAPDYFRSLPGTVDSLRDAMPSSLALPVQSGPNVSWNFTGLFYLPGWDSIRYYSPTLALPAVQYADDQLDSLSYSYHFNARLQQGIAGNGIMTYGMRVDSTSYSMGANTSNNNDTITLYGQDVVFIAAQNELALPASYPLNWQSTARGLIKGEVTCNTLHYNKAPYTLVTRRFMQDTVTGWGKLQLKDEKGVTSAAMDVLQVRSYVTRVDSGFINGKSIDHFEGLYMDVPQLIISSLCQEKYYRIGEVTPLVTITYTNTLRNQIKEVRVHQRRLNKLGVDGLPMQSKLSISPNPAASSIVSVNGIEDLQSRAYAYRIMDLGGQVAASGQLTTKTLSLPAEMNSGNYYVQITRDNEIVAVKPLSVTR